MNKKKMYTLSPIPEELETVKLLYSKYIELGSLTQLEGYCFENAIQSKNSKNYDKSALRSILTNPVYAIADELLYEYFERTNSDIANTKKEFDGKHGVFVYNKNIEKKGKRNKLRDKCEWIIAIGKHPGIINSIDWIKVQKMIEENSVKAPRTGTSKVALLTPLLTCAKCKSKLRVSYKVQNGEIMHHYYKCLLKERSRGTQCDMKNLNGQKAEQLVIEHFKKMASDADGWLKDLDDKKQGLSKISKKTSTNKLKLEKELKQHETSISNLTIQLSQNNSSAAAKYIIQQIETLDKKIADIKHELNTSENAQESNMIEQMNIEIIKNFVKSFASSVDDMEFDEKKRALKEIVKEIIWDGKHLDIKIFE
jgi:site-specific DNA recombinase